MWLDVSRIIMGKCFVIINDTNRSRSISNIWGPNPRSTQWLFSHSIFPVPVMSNIPFKVWRVLHFSIHISWILSGILLSSWPSRKFLPFCQILLDCTLMRQVFWLLVFWKWFTRSCVWSRRILFFTIAGSRISCYIWDMCVIPISFFIILRKMSRFWLSWGRWSLWRLIVPRVEIIAFRQISWGMIAIIFV